MRERAQFGFGWTSSRREMEWRQQLAGIRRRLHAGRKPHGAIVSHRFDRDTQTARVEVRSIPRA